MHRLVVLELLLEEGKLVLKEVALLLPLDLLALELGYSCRIALLILELTLEVLLDDLKLVPLLFLLELERYLGLLQLAL
jgi:hypothetical protein